jgi:pentatricopeptide repeat protein
MVDACLASGDVVGAAKVMRHVRPHLQDYPRASTVFAAITKACVKCRRQKLAIELYDEMKEAFVCGKVTYNMLIDVLVKQGDVERAGAVFQEMALQAVSPDLITYSTLIKGLSAQGDLQQGLVLLGQMQRRGIKPDAILFNSILDGCAHKQMRTLTEQVLADMEAAEIAPSNFTLSILVKLYGRCGDLPAARKVVEMYPNKYGFELNAHVYTCLMSALIAGGELQQALDLLDKMVQTSCAADAKTYQTILSGCIRHGYAAEAARIVGDTLEHGPHLERETVEGVLFLCVRSGQSSNLGVPLLQQLRQANFPVSERVRTAVLVQR